MEEPTEREVLEEKLRDVEANVTRYRALYEAGVTVQSATDGLRAAEAKLAEAKGYGKYIQAGGKRRLGSDTLEALLEEEQHLESLVKLAGRAPHGEVTRLLRRKNRLLRALLAL